MMVSWKGGGGGVMLTNGGGGDWCDPFGSGSDADGGGRRHGDFPIVCDRGGRVPNIVEN